MMADHFVDHEAQELLCEIGVEIRFRRQRTQARDLAFFSARIGGGEAGFGFIGTDGLRDLEPFGQHENQRRVDIVDTLAVMLQPVVRHARSLPNPAIHGLALAARAVQRNSR